MSDTQVAQHKTSPVKRIMEASPRKGMTELSPRRVPRSPLLHPKTPPQWKRPDEVMRLHRIKRQSLTARFNRLEQTTTTNTFKTPISTDGTTKRKNPFKIGELVNTVPKKTKTDVDQPNDSSSLFRLLGLADPQANHHDPLNFESIIEKIREQNLPKIKDKSSGRLVLPVDWALRFKLRFLSTKPFPWNQTLKTCEEASGITGFVRCIQNNNGLESGLDTSHNAMFHQCCLYWQFPNFPWLSLYPRKSYSKKPDTDKQLPSFASHTQVKDALHTDFTESFRSVFQLLRARHCPYFYLVTNSFTCLFRAAGINGSLEMNSLVSPTTQGFRQMLRDNDIEFLMPLRKNKKRKSAEGIEVPEEEEEELDEDDQGETRQWLASLGVEEKDINNLSSSQIETNSASESDIDGSSESLVYVEGSEVLSLFNFLINFRSVSASTGPLAGVPPTILSPVAFTRASLSNLQVKESTVKVDNDSFFSMEIKGPIIPETIHNLCDILNGSLEEFTVTFATDEPTKAFSAAVLAKCNENKSNMDDKKEVNIGSAFNVQNLSDSGMKPAIVSRFCSEDICNFDSIKFSEQMYTIV